MFKSLCLVGLAIASTLSFSLPTIADEADKKAKPASLKILLVAGGCCHDYAAQKDLLKNGIESRINAEVTIAYNPSSTTNTRFDIYKSADWADAYDVIIHDECSASVTEPGYVNRILDAHRKGKPAVNLHCAMHCYRWGDFRSPVKPGADNAGWYEMIGVQSTGHGPKFPMNVSYVDGHPITKGLKNWKTVNEELYNNVQIFDSAEVLATATQSQPPNKRQLKSDPNAKPTEAKAAIAWTNHYGPQKTRIFSTTVGHFNETVGDARYLDFVVRGLLWATDNLNDDGTAANGFGK